MERVTKTVGMVVLNDADAKGNVKRGSNTSQRSPSEPSKYRRTDGALNPHV